MDASNLILWSGIGPILCLFAHNHTLKKCNNTKTPIPVPTPRIQNEVPEILTNFTIDDESKAVRKAWFEKISSGGT